MARKNKKAGAAPLTSPQTREEMYLANIAGLVNTKPEYPFTRTERYLDAISSGTSGLADRVTALETDKVNTLGKGDNLLINAHFYRPVNQRWITTDTWISATDPATYNFIDRWQLTSGRAKLTTAGVVLEGTMIQTLEFAPYGDVVASVLGADGYLTPVYDTETRTFTITATGETLVAAKLELGTIQTLYSGTTLLDAAPNYQQELAKCQRYLLVVKSGGWTNYIASYAKSPDTANVGYLLIPTPVTMNAPATVSGGGKIRVTNGAARFQMDIANLAPSITGFSPYVAANLVTVKVPLDHAEAGSDTTITTGFADGGTNDNYIIISAE